MPNACRVYVISAMENCGFSPGDIRRVVAELYEVFDFRSLEDARQTTKPVPIKFWTLWPWQTHCS